MLTDNSFYGNIKIFLHHIYELQKGIRSMVLCTLSKKEEDFAVRRLQEREIDYCCQEVGNGYINIFFGCKECLNVVRTFVDRPLNDLTPEEDFILGTLLGYDICQQCERFFQQKKRNAIRA